MSVRKLRVRPLLAVVVGFMAFTNSLLADWAVDLPQSRIGFTAYSRLHDAEGEFTSWRFEGRISDNFRGKGKIIIQTSSVNSGNAKRDKHLRAPDFLDAEKFPETIYTIEAAQLVGDGLALRGRLTLHGVEKPWSITLARTRTASGWLLSGEQILQQKDFGMQNSSFINPVKSEVLLKIRIVLKKQ